MKRFGKAVATLAISALGLAVSGQMVNSEPLKLNLKSQLGGRGLGSVISNSPVQVRIPVAPKNDTHLLKIVASRVTKSPAQRTPTYQSWMSSEISDAWAAGFRGQGATITVVDDFSSRNYYSGNLGSGKQSLRHGEWTRLETSMIAPSAGIASHDFSTGRTVSLAGSGLNVLNLSYGMMAKSGYSASQIAWSEQENSIIAYGANGNAVVSKAAGNDAIAIGGTNRLGNTDYLNLALVGTQSTLFVGALDRNGTVDSKANIASYSNFAGSNLAVQQQFLSVGVRGDLTGLYGTSFAAPVVAGYAAVIGSKFTIATPTQIANRLLETARTDTISNYNAAVHGRGEASISRALAPLTIN